MKASLALIAAIALAATLAAAEDVGHGCQTET